MGFLRKRCGESRPLHQGSKWEFQSGLSVGCGKSAWQWANGWSENVISMDGIPYCYRRLCPICTARLSIAPVANQRSHVASPPGSHEPPVEPPTPIDPISALRGNDDHARHKALDLVLEQPEIDAATLDALFVGFERDGDVYHFQFYAKAFARAGERAIPRLTQYLNQWREGEYSARALAQIGRASVPALAETLRSSHDDQTLQNVSYAFNDICREEGTAAADLAPILAEGIKKESSRYWCLEAVRKLGPSVRDVILPVIKPLVGVEKGQWNSQLIGQLLDDYGERDELAFLDCHHKPQEILSRIELKLNDNSEIITEAVVRACTFMKQWHVEICDSMTGKNMKLAHENNDALATLMRAAAHRLPEPLLRELASLKDIFRGGWRSDSGEYIADEEVSPDGVRSAALAALKSRNAVVDRWHVALESTEAIRFAEEAQIVSDPTRRTSVVVLRPTHTPPPADVGIKAKLQCHGCWTKFPVEASFSTTGVTERREVCPNCQVQIAISTYPQVDGRLVIVASPGTDTAGAGQGGPVALWVDELL